ncbi:GNAT family N-acetyltransferase [Deinococcus yavapaiensis]|uniref:Acetyltransferase (GNAT) family protein n=1 Tax=Deinococcus yavapaiensis KR-236 TaxID=694435 RepID=A0A318S619_9DEIO|nr:GNAT family N-acetyltransferase [Deinococcus yavapaiensis]PYE54232.1 acetyltransferase (GNAT) family protein [Deinococcus yavapaiensis KR-236]
MLASELALAAERLEAWHLGLYTVASGTTATLGPVTVYHAGEPSPINFGLWHGRGPGTPQDNARSLASCEDFLKARGVTPFVTAFSFVHPAVLRSLAERSYQLVGLLHLHARTLDDTLGVPGAPCRVAPADEWLEVAVDGFGAESRPIMALTAKRPETTLWICDVDGVAASAGALSVRGQHAVLFSAATRPALRGRGAQTSLLRARLQHARSRGARFAFVMTSPGSDSERNVLRSGFSPLTTRLAFQRLASA